MRPRLTRCDHDPRFGQGPDHRRLIQATRDADKAARVARFAGGRDKTRPALTRRPATRLRGKARRRPGLTRATRTSQSGPYLGQRRLPESTRAIFWVAWISPPGRARLQVCLVSARAFKFTGSVSAAGGLSLVSGGLSQTGPCLPGDSDPRKGHPRTPRGGRRLVGGDPKFKLLDNVRLGLTRAIDSDSGSDPRKGPGCSDWGDPRHYNLARPPALIDSELPT